MSERKWYKEFHTHDEDGPLQSPEFSGEIYNQDGNYIASCGEVHSDLIASAPDMLEALNLAEQFIANGVESGYIVMPEENDPALETLSKIRAVIKKAKGEE